MGNLILTAESQPRVSNSVPFLFPPSCVAQLYSRVLTGKALPERKEERKPRGWSWFVVGSLDQCPVWGRELRHDSRNSSAHAVPTLYRVPVNPHPQLCEMVSSHQFSGVETGL